MSKKFILKGSKIIISICIAYYKFIYVRHNFRGKVKEVIMESQYILFSLNQAHYGIPIEYISEIAPYNEITVIPKLPHNIKGVVSFRGSIIPVIDIEREFGLKDSIYDEEDSRLIVLNCNDTEFAIHVESASESICIGDECIQDSSNIALGFQSEYIKGIGVKDRKLIFILDIANLIN